MENLPHNYSVKFDSKVIEAASPEEVIEQIKLLQKQHPDATFRVAGIAMWWTVEEKLAPIKKVFEIKWPIVFQGQHQGRFARWWSTFQAHRSHSLIISQPAPVEIIQNILQNYSKNLLDSCYISLFSHFENNVLRYSPLRKEVMIQSFRGRENGWVIKVLRKGSKGVVSSATWLLKLTNSEAVLTLYRRI